MDCVRLWYKNADMGTNVISQFRGLSLNGFIDEYAFPFSKARMDVLETVGRVLEAELVGKDYTGAHVFRRGTKLWTWLGISERRPLQEVSVLFSGDVMTLKYSIIGGIWLRFPPCSLEREAEIVASQV